MDQLSVVIKLSLEPTWTNRSFTSMHSTLRSYRRITCKTGTLFGTEQLLMATCDIFRGSRSFSATP